MEHNDADTESVPFVFIAHNDCDKHLLAPMLGQLLGDGVRVVVDNVYAFDQFDDYVAAGQLRQMRGGRHWGRDLINILESDACACVLGIVSFSASKLENPNDHSITRLEMQTALHQNKLLIIEIEPGAMEAFFQVPDTDHRLFKRKQYVRLRQERFAHDYDLIGDSVDALTRGQVCFGGRHSFERLVEEQASLALTLRGSRSSVVTNRFDAVDRCFACRLVPGDDARVEHFWLTETPVADTVDSAVQVERLLDETRGFRLPTEAQLTRALAPRGSNIAGDNPFGFTTNLADGVWAQRGSDIVIVGCSDRTTAPVLLVYTG